MTVHAVGDLDGDGRADLAIDYGPQQFFSIEQEFFAVEPAAPDELLLLPGSARRWAGDVDLLALPNRLPQAFAATSPMGVPAPGDIDGDGFADLVAIVTSAAEPMIFYGGPELLATPLDASRAATSLLVGDQGSIVALGDLDGDGDAELGVERYVRSPSRRIDGNDLALLGGSHARQNGAVTFSEPSLDGARLYSNLGDTENRYHGSTVPVGDLDGDGAEDLVTTSVALFEDRGAADPRLHIHYGTPVSASPGQGPR